MSQIEKLKNLISKLTNRTGLVDFYMQEVSLLEKKESTLRICDFDDTLFSRTQQLESEELLKNNRGASGNTTIFNTLGLHNYMEKYYAGVSFPQDILSQLDKSTDLIMTAGMPELQKMKVRNAGLDTYNLKIVDNAEKKILEMIRYIIFELKYIPSKIIVYEDRPQFFIEYRELIEGILGTKVTIFYIEMDGNEGYKKIEEV